MAEPVSRFTVYLPWGASLAVVVDASEAVELVGKLASNLEAPAGFWQEVGDRMRESWAEKFRTAGKGRWAPLRPSTVAEKRRLGFPLDPLIREGKLEASYTEQGAFGHIEEVAPDGQSLVIGSEFTRSREITPEKPVRHYHLLSKRQERKRAKGGSVWGRLPIARFHHLGAPGAHLPARPVAEVEPEDLDWIEKAACRWVLGEQDDRSIPDHS